MKIIKRNGNYEEYNSNKIKIAVKKSFIGLGIEISEDDLLAIVETSERNLKVAGENPSVEFIQDCVEKALMERGFYDAAKAYILYRQHRNELRKSRNNILNLFSTRERLEKILIGIEQDYREENYSLDHLFGKYLTFQKPQMNESDKLAILIKAAVELTTKEAPLWEMIAARLLRLDFALKLEKHLVFNHIQSLYDKIVFMTNEGLYGKYILQNYSKEEIDNFQNLIDNDRDKLFNYSGLNLLISRYVIKDHQNKPVETPQEMFLGIAMHLAINEKNDRSHWVAEFYNMLSTLKVTMATPTLANARKPFHQLSSCFIDVVPDSLSGIYRSISNFANVSKFGGGMGLYFGKVRASGSSIRGFEGAAGGVIRWIKLANDTAVAVDQLGVRQGAVAVYLDVWHRDLPEFLNLRTNNGDDRMKAHDIFPAVCFPDYFWEKVRDDLNSSWYMMCPHEIQTIKGYCLEDFFGEEWKKRYLDCLNDSRITKREIPLKDLVRLIIKSASETGTPFIFNRDIVNRANPNSHKGIIYCSNLCTEIAQNTSEIQEFQQSIKEIDGQTVVVNETLPGDFVVCNLASLSLGKINVQDEAELERIVKASVRALDNVIDINFYPVPYAQITNGNYRAIGLGVSGYHHLLAKNNIAWESEEHLKFVDQLFEKINYFAIKASCENAADKGSYKHFDGSEWQSGEYFQKRNYNSEKWLDLAQKVKQHGLRNGYLLAIAPTSSTSIIAGTTAGVDPIMNQFFYEEKKTGLVPRVAPELSIKTLWFYKSAHTVNQLYSIKACGIRQRHVDQAQSMNLYITTDFSFRGILDLYLAAFEAGVKTIYYIRSKSLEVEECEFCAS